MMIFSLAGQDRDQLRDHLYYEGGTVYQVTDQGRVRLQERIVLNDGTVVNPDGSYQTNTGRQLKLKDRQCADMEGNIYRSEKQFRKDAPSRLQAGQQEHIAYRNGQLYRIRNNEETKIEKQLKLANGITVNPDGTYQKGNQKKVLLNGECIDMDGKRYATQEQFREKMSSHMRERSRDQMGEKSRMHAKEKARKETPSRRKGS